MKSFLFLIKVTAVVMMDSLLSCQNNEEVYNASDFPTEKQVTSHIITDSALIAYSYGMDVDDQNIYIHSLVDND